MVLPQNDCWLIWEKKKNNVIVNGFLPFTMANLPPSPIPQGF